jgi:hypothetical protein
LKNKIKSSKKYSIVINVNKNSGVNLLKDRPLFYYEILNGLPAKKRKGEGVKEVLPGRREGGKNVICC